MQLVAMMMVAIDTNQLHPSSQDVVHCEVCGDRKEGGWEGGREERMGGIQGQT